MPLNMPLNMPFEINMPLNMPLIRDLIAIKLLFKLSINGNLMAMNSQCIASFSVPCESSDGRGGIDAQLMPGHFPFPAYKEMFLL